MQVMRSQHSGWCSQSKLIKIFISKTNDPKPFWRQQNISTTFQSYNCNLMKINVSDYVVVIVSYLAVYYYIILFKCRWWICKLITMHWITNIRIMRLYLKSQWQVLQYIKIINNKWYLLLSTIFFTNKSIVPLYMRKPIYSKYTRN